MPDDLVDGLARGVRNLERLLRLSNAVHRRPLEGRALHADELDPGAVRRRVAVAVVLCDAARLAARRADLQAEPGEDAILPVPVALLLGGRAVVAIGDGQGQAGERLVGEELIPPDVPEVFLLVGPARTSTQSGPVVTWLGAPKTTVPPSASIVARPGPRRGLLPSEAESITSNIVVETCQRAAPAATRRRRRRCESGSDGRCRAPPSEQEQDYDDDHHHQIARAHRHDLADLFATDKRPAPGRGGRAGGRAGNSNFETDSRTGQLLVGRP